MKESPRRSAQAAGSTGSAYDLELINVTKRFGEQLAVNDLSLQVRKGEFVAFLGPSGCGKTTTLRMIAGFLQPDGGQIKVVGEDLSRLPPYRRGLGMVFQQYALFPHLTVFENVAFGLRERKIRAAEIERRVTETLQTVDLAALAKRLPKQLSGGQQQRVALARAIVIQPKLLLLDEPLSNLDAKLRQQMRLELKALQQRLGLTTIFVTHDQEEALTMADRVVIMRGGRIEQVGTPEEVYQQPRTRFIADFIGEMNLLPGRWEAGAFAVAGGTRLPGTLISAGAGGEAVLAVRSEAVHVALEPAGNGMVSVPGTVDRAIFFGSQIGYQVLIAGGHRCLVRTPSGAGVPRLEPGSQVYLVWAPEQGLVLDAQ